MSNPPTLDPAALQRLRRIGGTKLLAEMIDLMLTEGPLRLEVALEAAQAGSARDVAQAMHSLKSSAGNLGAFALQDLAQQIEILAMTDQLAACEGLLSGLHHELEMVQTRLQDERGRLS